MQLQGQYLVLRGTLCGCATYGSTYMGITCHSSNPLSGGTGADRIIHCPEPWNHGYTKDYWNVQLLGNSCADNGNAQLLDANPVRAA
jgi:hypothetical protein